MQLSTYRHLKSRWDGSQIISVTVWFVCVQRGWYDVLGALWCRRARRERIRQRYAAIAADKLYSDVPPTIADEDYGPATSVSTAYMKTAGRSPQRRPPATDYTHVWQLPLPQPHDDVMPGCVTSSSAGGAAYVAGSIDSRYYVLDHNQGSSVIPTNDDIQFMAAQWHGVTWSTGSGVCGDSPCGSEQTNSCRIPNICLTMA